MVPMSLGYVAKTHLLNRPGNPAPACAPLGSRASRATGHNCVKLQEFFDIAAEDRCSRCEPIALRRWEEAKHRQKFTREGALAVCKHRGHQMGPWRGDTATCEHCGKTVHFDATQGASGGAWERGKCGMVPNGIDHSRHPTVVQYAVQEMFKGKSPSAAAKKTAESLSGGINMFIDPNNEVSIDPKELEDALWLNLAQYASKGMRPGDDPRNAARGALMYFQQWKWGKPHKTKMEDKILLYMSRPEHTPNSERRYYIWVINHDGTPKDEGPYGPFEFINAKTSARIAATEGSHDRVVSIGADPHAASFDIVRRYQAGTGDRVQ